MTYYAICGLIGFFTGIACSIFIFLHKPRTALKVLWGLYSLGMALYGFASFYLFTTTRYETALFWCRVENLIVFFIPLFFFHIVVLLTDTFEQYKKTVVIYYLFFISYFLTALCLPGYFVPSVSAKLNFLFYADAGPLYYFFPVALFYAFIHGWTILYKTAQKAPAVKRNQYKYFFWITAVCIPGAATGFLLVFNIPLFPFGTFLLPVHDIAVAYIIVKYNLMDINIIIRRSLIYSLLVTTITFMFFIFVIVSEHLFHQVVHYQNVGTSMIMVGLIALVFTPLKNRIQNLVDHAFLKATPMEIAQQIEELRQKEKTLVDLYSQADKLSKTDTLTEINNRRHFSEMLNKKMQDSEAAGTCFYLVIFDVDHFKEINDSYGHPLGDMVLIKVVGVVKSNIRSNDFIGRFGGDEFIICLDFPNKEGILSRLTKIRNGIKELSFTHEGKEVPISVSIGAAKFLPGMNMTEKSLIEKADAELFNVKKTTRGEISIKDL